ncbi:manganese ABC transporter permease [Bacillus sp. VT-16-64]|nr:manganese ABC transporter permease [Bacillus sp. VT-16-64]
MDANTQWVLFGTLLLGIASGVLGSFALLRKQSLIGDAMAHAALPGVCLAFMLYGEKSMPIFLLGAALAGLLATYCIQVISKQSRIKEDTAIGLILSVFFGFGIVLLTRITQSPAGNKSGLDAFIFGKAASLVGSDVTFIAISAIVLLFITALFFKEFKLLSFDPQFAQGIGMPVKWMNGLLMVLIVGAVVIGIQAVGVVLMSAMLITPAIAARYWTDKLSTMVLLSGAIGGISGICGTLLSTMAEKMATGPIIVVAATVVFLFSLLCAPRRGLISKALKHIQVKKQTAKEYVMISLYELYEKTNDKNVYSFTVEQINERRPFGTYFLNQAITRLEKEGYIKPAGENRYMLTNKGLTVAHEYTLNHRLHEVYLMHEREFAVPDVEDIRTDMEKLPPQIMTKLKEKLSQYGREPMLLNNQHHIKERKAVNEL